MFLAPLMPFISGAASLATGIAGGMAQKSASNYNAQVATMQAEQARDAGNIKAASLARDQAQQMGATRSAAGASGTLMGAGNTGQIIQDTATAQTRDQRMLEYNTQLSEWGHQTEAVNQRAAGKYAMTAGIIGGVAGAASSYGGYKLRNSNATPATQGSQIKTPYREVY